MPPLDAFNGFLQIMPGFQARPRISHVAFDFDGTISLIRQGWPEVMVPMLVELLPRVDGDTDEGNRQMLYDDIMELNGKQTIYQMIQFAERVKERGGEPKEPVWYKREYLRRLDERIGDRVAGLRDGSVRREEWLVHRVGELLDKLRERGVVCYLLSGTDEEYVREEAALLGVDSHFEDRIYGARDDYQSFSKKIAMDRMFEEHGITGENLLSFGDGYVEIQNTKQLGGLAVAVASAEANNGSGKVDEWKRQRLLGVGADIVIADYRDAGPLLDMIFGN
jgi:phosphoglycolate phosphatase-like HAD superfamily hydrolase